MNIGRRQGNCFSHPPCRHNDALHLRVASPETRHRNAWNPWRPCQPLSRLGFICEHSSCKRALILGLVLPLRDNPPGPLGSRHEVFFVHALVYLHLLEHWHILPVLPKRTILGSKFPSSLSCCTQSSSNDTSGSTNGSSSISVSVTRCN